MTDEAHIQQTIRLESHRRHDPLLRNNSGACRDDRGRMIRYGLGNDSAKINKVFKSSDLIGIHRVLITPEMIGTVIGQFWAVEAKRPGWRMGERETAQLAFGEWVRRYGGRFDFATSVEDLWG